MPDETGEPVVTTVCLLPFAHGLRVHRTPGIPCALYLRRDNSYAQLGRIAPRDRGRVPGGRRLTPFPGLNRSSYISTVELNR
jgi:hypothetical protein